MVTLLRLLTGIPLVVLATILLVNGIQRATAPVPPPVKAMTFGEILVADDRLDDALGWYRWAASGGSPTAQRALAAVADLADEPGLRANALQHLVRSGAATFEEHVEAARALAAAGGLSDALAVLYNAEQRFPERADVRFLSFYAALALDAKRPDIALPLAQHLWQRSGGDQILAIMKTLSPR